MGTELPRSPLADALGGVVRAEAKRQGLSEAALYRRARIASSGPNYFSDKAKRVIPLSAIESVAIELGFSVSELFRLAEQHIEPAELERFLQRVKDIKGISDKERDQLLRAIE